MPEDIVPNWITLIVEIFVGIAIAWYVHHVYKKTKNERLDEVSETLTRKLIPLVVRARAFIPIFERLSEEHYRNFTDEFWEEIEARWTQYRESNKLLDDTRMSNPNIISLKLDDELRELSRQIKTDLDRNQYDLTTQLIYNVYVYSENCLERLKKYADKIVRENKIEIDERYIVASLDSSITGARLKTAENIKKMMENNLKELTGVLDVLKNRGFG